MRRVRARSVKVQWDSDSLAPTVDELRRCFEVWGAISTVKVKGATALILYRDASSVSGALENYVGGWTVRGTSEDAGSRGSTPMPTPTKPRRLQDEYDRAHERLQRGRALERVVARASENRLFSDANAPIRAVRIPNLNVSQPPATKTAPAINDTNKCLTNVSDGTDSTHESSYVVVDTPSSQAEAEDAERTSGQNSGEPSPSATTGNDVPPPPRDVLVKSAPSDDDSRPHEAASVVSTPDSAATSASTSFTGGPRSAFDRPARTSESSRTMFFDPTAGPPSTFHHPVSRAPAPVKYPLNATAPPPRRPSLDSQPETDGPPFGEKPLVADIATRIGQGPPRSVFSNAPSDDPEISYQEQPELEQDQDTFNRESRATSDISTFDERPRDEGPPKQFSFPPPPMSNATSAHTGKGLQGPPQNFYDTAPATYDESSKREELRQEDSQANVIGPPPVRYGPSSNTNERVQEGPPQSLFQVPSAMSDDRPDYEDTFGAPPVPYDEPPKPDDQTIGVVSSPPSMLDKEMEHGGPSEHEQIKDSFVVPPVPYDPPSKVEEQQGLPQDLFDAPRTTSDAHLECEDQSDRHNAQSGFGTPPAPEYPFPKPGDLEGPPQSLFGGQSITHDQQVKLEVPERHEPPLGPFDAPPIPLHPRSMSSEQEQRGPSQSALFPPTPSSLSPSGPSEQKQYGPTRNAFDVHDVPFGDSSRLHDQKQTEQSQGAFGTPPIPFGAVLSSDESHPRENHVSLHTAPHISYGQLSAPGEQSESGPPQSLFDAEGAPSFGFVGDSSAPTSDVSNEQQKQDSVPNFFDTPRPSQFDPPSHQVSLEYSLDSETPLRDGMWTTDCPESNSSKADTPVASFDEPTSSSLPRLDSQMFTNVPPSSFDTALPPHGLPPSTLDVASKPTSTSEVSPPPFAPDVSTASPYVDVRSARTLSVAKADNPSTSGSPFFSGAIPPSASTTSAEGVFGETSASSGVQGILQPPPSEVPGMGSPASIQEPTDFFNATPGMRSSHQATSSRDLPSPIHRSAPEVLIGQVPPGTHKEEKASVGFDTSPVSSSANIPPFGQQTGIRQHDVAAPTQQRPSLDGNVLPFNSSGTEQPISLNIASRVPPSPQASFSQQSTFGKSSLSASPSSSAFVGTPRADKDDRRPPHACVALGFGGRLATVNRMDVAFFSTTSAQEQRHVLKHRVSLARLPGRAEILLVSNPSTVAEREIAETAAPFPSLSSMRALISTPTKRGDGHVTEIRRYVEAALQRAQETRGKMIGAARSDGLDAACVVFWSQLRRLLDVKQSGSVDAFLEDAGVQTVDIKDEAFPLCATRKRSKSIETIDAKKVEESIRRGDVQGAVNASVECELWPVALILASTLEDGNATFRRVVSQYSNESLDAGSALYARSRLLGQHDRGAAMKKKEVLFSENPAPSKLSAVPQHEPASLAERWCYVLAYTLIQSTETTRNAMAKDLGDRLGEAYGDRAALAAHVAYVAAGVPHFSSLKGRIGLVGLSQENTRPSVAAIAAALRRTEILDVARTRRGLDAGANPECSTASYRLLHARLLADVGALDEAAAYCADAKVQLSKLQSARSKSAKQRVGNGPVVSSHESEKNAIATFEDRLSKHGKASLPLVGKDTKLDAHGQKASGGLMGMVVGAIGEKIAQMTKEDETAEISSEPSGEVVQSVKASFETTHPLPASNDGDPRSANLSLEIPRPVDSAPPLPASYPQSKPMSQTTPPASQPLPLFPQHTNSSNSSNLSPFQLSSARPITQGSAEFEQQQHLASPSLRKEPSFRDPFLRPNPQQSQEVSKSEYTALNREQTDSAEPFPVSLERQEPPKSNEERLDFAAPSSDLNDSGSPGAPPQSGAQPALPMPSVSSLPDVKNAATPVSTSNDPSAPITREQRKATPVTASTPQKSKKPPRAPSSAPTRRKDSNKKSSLEQKPGPISRLLSSWLYPDAKSVDWDSQVNKESEPYFDEKTKQWVFPNASGDIPDDPGSKPPPTSFPPVNPPESPSIPHSQSTPHIPSNNAAKSTTADDPMAALVAPPPVRIPRASSSSVLMRSKSEGTSLSASRPKYATFAPPPS